MNGRKSAHVGAPAAFAATAARAGRRAADESRATRRARSFSASQRWLLVVLYVGIAVAALWAAMLLFAPHQPAMALADRSGSSATESPADARAPASPTMPSESPIVSIAPRETTTPASEAPPTSSPRPDERITPAPSAPTRIPPLPMSTPLPAPPDRLVIQAIHLDTPVTPVGWNLVFRDSTWITEWEVARNVAGWHNTSAAPGEAGNVVLSGHHNIEGEVFRDLALVRVGDEIQLYAGGVEFCYRVTETMIVPEKGASEVQREENARWIGPFPDERLTLITCWPHTNNTHRVIVVAKPIAE